VADGTIFERKGVQTAAIVTHTFTRPGDAMARVQGFTNYEYVLMTHPISSLDQQQVRERAEQALPQVLKILGLSQTQAELAAAS
jgi:threonyl-tRNA synthetase